MVSNSDSDGSDGSDAKSGDGKGVSNPSFMGSGVK